MNKFRKMYIGALELTVATALAGFATAGTCGACGDDVKIGTAQLDQGADH